MYCLCVNVYCHRVTTQLQLTNISISYYVCRAVRCLITSFPHQLRKGCRHSYTVQYQVRCILCWDKFWWARKQTGFFTRWRCLLVSLYSVSRRWINEYRALVELYWEGNKEVPAENPVCDTLSTMNVTRIGLGPSKWGVTRDIVTSRDWKGLGWQGPFRVQSGSPASSGPPVHPVPFDFTLVLEVMGAVIRLSVTV